MKERHDLLRRVCQKYKDPFRPETAVLSPKFEAAEANTRLGVEVVHLRGRPLTSVCIPHKVGSHAWGKFAALPEVAPDPLYKELSWRAAANLSHRAVVVRHPMERLLSVYRMVFEDWCDENKFLSKQWNNVCVTSATANNRNIDGLKKGFIEDNEAGGGLKKKFNAIEFLVGMADEQRHGNDRYVQAIWRKFNPGAALVDPKRQLKFTFGQFVRFIVNGSREFGRDVLDHRGLSYHWAPYWSECNLCNPEAAPHTVLHMETFVEDLRLFLKRSGLAEAVSNRDHDGALDDLVAKFPHTHSQAGGHSQTLATKYFSTLKRSQVNALYEMYKLDHELFGYKPDFYLSLAKPD